jgi:hypothetical protein
VSPHHVRENRELRITVSFPPNTPVEERADALNELMLTMKEGMGLNERLTRLPGLEQKAGPLRVFVYEFREPGRCSEVLRALGGWYMRYAGLTVTVRGDAPAGGINLQLNEFSTVAFAQAAAKLGALMAERPPD